MNIKNLLALIVTTITAFFQDEKKEVTDKAKELALDTADRMETVLAKSASGELNGDDLKAALKAEENMIITNGLALAQLAESGAEFKLTTLATTIVSIALGAVTATQKE